jgi:hypothetical protein
MKRVAGLLLLVLFFSAAAFAQRERTHKYEPFDMLIGINLGGSIGIGGKILEPVKSEDDTTIRFGDGYITGSNDIGLTCDFYIFNWLSVNTGLLLHPQINVIWKKEYNNATKKETASTSWDDTTQEDDEVGLQDVMQLPLCLTIPLQAHINVPRAEWFYVGIGMNINIPIAGLFDRTAEFVGAEMPDTKGDVFISLPIDLGFDFIKPMDNGGRLFFRMTPSFIQKQTLWSYGFIWQIYNFRIDTK